MREVYANQIIPDLTVQNVATQQLPDLADVPEDEDAEAEQQDEVFIGQKDDLQDGADIAIGGPSYDSDHGKRKAEEIAGSDEDEDIDLAKSQATADHSSMPNGNRKAGKQDLAFQTAKKYRTRKSNSEQVPPSQSSIGEQDHESEDMILGLHESQQ